MQGHPNDMPPARNLSELSNPSVSPTGKPLIPPNIVKGLVPVCVAVVVGLEAWANSGGPPWAHAAAIGAAALCGILSPGWRTYTPPR